MSLLLPNIQRFIPTTGATITILPSESLTIYCVIEPATTLAALTITIPTCFNGQEIIICSTQIITAITITGSVLPLTTLGLNSGNSFVYSLGQTKWYKTQ